MSCASTTHIRVMNPQGNNDNEVKIYLNGEYKGKGSVSHTDKNVLFSSQDVRMKKQGCRDKYREIQKDEVKVGRLIGAFFIWPIVLWSFGYKNHYNFEYECDK